MVSKSACIKVAPPKIFIEFGIVRIQKLEVMSQGFGAAKKEERLYCQACQRQTRKRKERIFQRFNLLHYFLYSLLLLIVFTMHQKQLFTRNSEDGYPNKFMVFENHEKSLNERERSELRLQFESGQKLIKMQKVSNLGSF